MHLFKHVRRLLDKRRRPRCRRNSHNQQSPGDSGNALDITHTIDFKLNGEQYTDHEQSESPLESSLSEYEYSNSSIDRTDLASASYSSKSEELDGQLAAEIESSRSTIAGGQRNSNTEMHLPVDSGKVVQLVELKLSSDSKLSGTVMVANLAYQKNIFIRWTADNWTTYCDQMASYDHSSDGFSHDWFTFTTDSPFLQKGKDGAVCVELAVAYQVNGQEFWDNNQRQNFTILLK